MLRGNPNNGCGGNSTSFPGSLSSFSHPPRAREGTRGECHKQIFKTGYLVSPELQDFDFKNIDNVKGRE